MRFLRALVAAVAVALLSVSGALAAPIEAYGKLPTIESATVSPSGHAVAVVLTNGEDRTIVVISLKTGEVTLRGFLGDHKIRSVDWAGDDHLLVVASNTSNAFDLLDGYREWYFGSIIDLKKKRLRPLMQQTEADLSVLARPPVVREYRGEPMVFAQGVIFSGSRGRVALFRIDLDNGGARLVGTGEPDTIDWIVDPEGQPLAQELYNTGSGRWSIKVKTDDGWREAVSVAAPLDRPYVLGLGRTGRSVAYAVRGDDRHWGWREISVLGGDASEPIEVENGQGPLRAALDGRLIGEYALVGDEGHYRFFDPRDEKAWKAIETAFAGQRVSLQSWSSARRKIVVLVDSDTEGPRFAVVDLIARQADWLGPMYAGLGPGDISERRPIRFRAADGLPLSGYLTLPRGRPAKALPLVVFPHGGPAARDEPGFDWWAQAMASRGYAVLQVNFRGSEGLGGALLEAGYGQWGRKMQTDLSDGVRDLAAKGIVDPKRVCIVGGSYGGYAALAGAALDPGVYRCAVSVAGLSDLKRFVIWARNHQGSPSYRYWNRFMGSEDAGDPKLAEISPALRVDQVSIPVLLIHGKDDTVVPLEQSQVMADALRGAGKPVELIVEKGEDHWLSRGETRLDVLKATIAFLEKHNPPN
jgi:dipeptidyl aminopeptidase/acylaminoacyl peptidase